MRRSGFAWLRIRTFSVAAWHVVALVLFGAAFFDTPAISKPAPSTARWSLIKEQIGGRPTCLLLGRASPNTWLTLKIDSGDQARNLISFQFVNLNWSIKSGDELGEIHFLNGSGGSTVVPIAGDRGFFLYLDADLAEAWLKLEDEQGMWLERDGKILERLSGGNLPSQVGKLRECGARLYSKDPFGQ